MIRPLNCILFSLSLSLSIYIYIYIYINIYDWSDFIVSLADKSRQGREGEASGPREEKNEGSAAASEVIVGAI